MIVIAVVLADVARLEYCTGALVLAALFVGFHLKMLVQLNWFSNAIRFVFQTDPSSSTKYRIWTAISMPQKRSMLPSSPWPYLDDRVNMGSQVQTFPPIEASLECIAQTM